MAWVYAFFAVAALALIGVVGDAVAIKRKRMRGTAIVSLVLKGLVAAAFAAWAVIFGVLRRASGWEDLATFAGVLLFSLVALAVAVILDAVIAVRLSNKPD